MNDEQTDDFTAAEKRVMNDHLALSSWQMRTVKAALLDPAREQAAREVIKTCHLIFESKFNSAAGIAPDELAAWKLVEPGRVSDYIASRRGPMSGAERTRRHIANERDIVEIPPVANVTRRESCRLDLVKFGTTYCRPFLKHAPSARMVDKLITPMQEAILHGGQMLVEISRGIGKTSWSKAGIVWAVCYNHREFPVCIAATGKLAAGILKDVWRIFEESNELLEDFPELAIPIREINGIAQRCTSQTFRGERTKTLMKVDTITLPLLKDDAGEIIGSANGSIVGSVGVGGSVRGIVNMSRRPDMLFLDDIQKRSDAKSPSRVKWLENFVQSDALGLAGHEVTLSAIMALTPIGANDFTTRMANRQLHPEWSMTIQPFVITWSKRPDLVDLFQAAYREDCANDDFSRTLSSQFYRDHRDEISEGVEVLDPHCHDPAEIDAFHHALNLIARVGRESFDAEYQMQTQEDVSLVAVNADRISRALSGVKEFELPPGTSGAVAFCDVNIQKESALRFGILAVGPGRVCSVIAYSRYPKTGRLSPEGATDTQVKVSIARGMRAVAEIIRSAPLHRHDGSPIHLTALCFDGGWEMETVARSVFAMKNSLPLPFSVVWSHGFYWKSFSTAKIVRSMRGDHVYVAESKHGQYLAYHSDYWREQAQSAFLAPPLTPGSCCLFGSDPVRHWDFAVEASNERLSGKFVRQDGKMEWDWNICGANHWGDVLSGCFMVASWYRLYDSTTRLVDTATAAAAREESQKPSPAQPNLPVAQPRQVRRPATASRPLLRYPKFKVPFRVR